MKKILLILILTILMPVSANAGGLAIDVLFTEKVVSDPAVTAVTVSGSKAKRYRLAKYRSVSVASDSPIAANVEKRVRADGAKAASKEVSYKKGKLYYGFYTLQPSSTGNRYIVYLNSTLTGGRNVTLIYMEGQASEEDVRKLMKR